MSEAVGRLGALLREARTSRSLTLSRAEEETRIRSGYLSALERGDYPSLPGPVYTKGFLRSYAGYLGLDGEHLVDLYRIETAGGAAPLSVERPRAPRLPTPVALPRAFAISRGVLLAVLIGVGVTTLVGWLGYQLATYARIPTLVLTDPAGDVVVAGSRYVIRGQTVANATVSASGLAGNPTAEAGPDGTFAIEVELLPGRNLIDLEAYDPQTGRVTETVRLRIVAEPPPPEIGEGS